MSMPNNVKSCKTTNFSVFARGRRSRQELLAKNMKTGETKTAEFDKLSEKRILHR